MTTSRIDQSDGWTGPRPFVGRDHLVERIHRIADDAIRGRGRVLFVVGEAGAGKERLVGRLLELNDVREHPAAVVSVRAGGSPDAWEAARRRVTRRRRIRHFLATTVPEWISAIPVVGNLLAAIIRTVQLMRSRDTPDSDASAEPRGRAGAIAAVDELIAEARGPTFVVIKDFERAGDHDLAGTFHSLRAIAGKPVLVVATVELRRGRPPHAVVDVIREAERYDAGETIRLEPLPSSAWQQALARATGAPPPPRWIEWFAERQPLTPGRLWAFLGDVQAMGGIEPLQSEWRWTERPAGQERRRTQDRDLGSRLEGLEPDDRRFLALLTWDGPTFTSEEARLRSGQSELQIQDRLARLERERWIRFVETSGTEEEPIDVYVVAVEDLVEALAIWSRNP